MTRVETQFILVFALLFNVFMLASVGKISTLSVAVLANVIVFGGALGESWLAERCGIK